MGFDGNVDQVCFMCSNHIFMSSSTLFPLPFKALPVTINLKLAMIKNFKTYYISSFAFFSVIAYFSFIFVDFSSLSNRTATKSIL